ncbi:MAG: hypothetical protein ACYDHW_04840 [Syntrophorhabdaceae bacterium]
MFSVAYFNEGHHDTQDIMNARDGFAAQLWARAFPAKQLSVGLGIGPYLYFNTRTGEDVVECDIQHGVGVMSSGTLTWHGLSPLLFQIRTDYVHTWDSLNTFSGSLGIGFLFDEKGISRSGEKIKETFDTKNEIDLLVGRTILNSDNSEGTALSVEYRRKLFRYLDWSIAWLHEGDKRPVGRYGVLSELWLQRKFYNDRFAMGIGAGPYFARDRYGDDDTQRDTLAGAVSVTAALRITDNLGIRAVFHRIYTDYTCDADVILGGLAINF